MREKYSGVYLNVSSVNPLRSDERMALQLRSISARFSHSVVQGAEFPDPLSSRPSVVTPPPKLLHFHLLYISYLYY